MVPLDAIAAFLARSDADNRIVIVCMLPVKVESQICCVPQSQYWSVMVNHGAIFISGREVQDPGMYLKFWRNCTWQIGDSRLIP